MSSSPSRLRQGLPAKSVTFGSPDSKYRAKTKPWYGTAQWKRRRREQLTREPLCWMCQRDGKIVAATVADHDPPHRGNWTAFITGPLKSLCKPHHDSDKALIENGKGTGRIGPDGWPVEG